MTDIAVAVRRVAEAGRTKPWGVFWREPIGNGKRQKRSRYFVTEDEATTFKNDVVAGIRAAAERQVIKDILPPPKAGTVGEYLKTWLDVDVKPKLDTASYVNYEMLVRLHIVSATLSDGTTFGDVKMSKLRRRVVRMFYQALFDNKVALPTRRQVHACLSSALGRAVLDEVLEYNPCAKLGKDLRHKGERTADPHPTPFEGSRDDLATFLGHVEEHERDWLEYFQFVADTGVRVGEAAALKWATVDLKRRRAEIVASYSRFDKGDKLPKDHQCRWIDLTDLVVEQLADLQKRQRVEFMRRGQPLNGYVFTNSRGTPRRPANGMARVFDRIIDACGIGRTTVDGRVVITRHTPHDLRHTFATIHLSDNYMKLPWVSRQLGHETERTTVDRYFRFLPSTVTEKFANQIR